MNHLGWACEGGVRMHLLKLNNSWALWGSLCGWLWDASASSCCPCPFAGDKAAGPGDETYRRDSRHSRGAPGWLQSRGSVMSGCVGGARWEFICMMTAAVFYHCHKNNCKLRGSKTTWVYQFIVLCVRSLGELGRFLQSKSHKAKVSVLTGQDSSLEVLGETLLPASPSSVPCGFPTELLFPPGCCGRSPSAW